MINYKEINGTSFNVETPELLANAINSALSTRDRVRVWYGENGKSWNEENDITGYIGRSGGAVKIPLLVSNTRSMGGGGLLDSSIVKMVSTKTGRVLYQHKNFSQSVFTSVGASVYGDGELYANCKSESSAQRLSAFMNGERNSK